MDLFGWDWRGIFTHLSLEEFGGIVLAGLMWWGRYHAHTRRDSRFNRLIHTFAHSVKAQFAVDFVIDVFVAVVTIQLLHL